MTLLIIIVVIELLGLIMFLGTSLYLVFCAPAKIKIKSSLASIIIGILLLFFTQGFKVFDEKLGFADGLISGSILSLMFILAYYLYKIRKKEIQNNKEKTLN